MPRKQRMKVRVAVAALVCLSSTTAFAADDGQYAEFDGVKIHYIDRGKGEPIVLLHGGTSSLDGWVRTGVVANLEKDFRVIAFDARGSGKSSKPHDPRAYGRQQALDVPRLLDALKLDRAHIVGFSLGSSTVAQLLTLAPPNAKPTEEEYRRREAQCRADADFDQLSVAASLRGYHDQAVTADEMRAVKVPTLGIVGTLDHTLQEMRELKRLRPDMKFVLLEGVSHTGPTGIQGRPELPAAIREFIASQRSN